MKNGIKDITASGLKWNEVTPGGTINRAGNANDFKTGDWRSKKPIWKEEKCKQCGLCPPVCPDASIPVGEGGKRKDFDYDHCKGCGVCVEVCPFDAIDFADEE
jgi:pyruvate ferredoxin oxidoreductase delta subunit